MKFAIAMNYRTNTGEYKVRAYLQDATSKAEALGKSMLDLSDVKDLNMLCDWAVTLDGDYLAEAAREVYDRTNNRIKAIKQVREMSGRQLGLKEAKEIVDRAIGYYQRPF